MLPLLRVSVAMVALALASFAAAAPTEQDWVARSNANAKPFLELIATYRPETASSLGVDGHDADVSDLKPRVVERMEADLAKVQADFEARLAQETDPRVRADLEILITAARDQRRTSELNRRLMIQYIDVPQLLFGSFNSLLDKRVAKERYPAALERLARYVGRAPGYEPIARLAEARMQDQFAVPGVTGPWKVEVEQNLKNRERYIQGIRELFERSGLKGWEKDLKLLDQQLAEHERWVRTELLPRARATNLLPPEIYADNLRNFGVSADPRELMDEAVLSFVQTREEMQTLATLVAKQRGYPSADYRAVLARLKAETIPQDKLLSTYQARLASLEDIIRRERIVTMPDRPAVIRLATAAESAQQPAPHLNPPRLIGNTGESAEFVLPLENPNAPPGTKMDDFTNDAISWTLTAHEARPGHELQFAKMIENGVSIPRAIFAFNSANVEGWALYAESLVKRHLPLEGQIGTLQLRMMREARAFLDPMVNLGLIDPAAAQQFLMKEVGLSEPMAKQEVDRYSFNAPGQATSYFYGYRTQLELRGKAELALGDRFDPLAYHDFVIDQGLLPPNLLEKAVMERFVEPRKSAEKAVGSGR